VHLARWADRYAPACIPSVHLGRYEKPEDALEAWPTEVRHLRRIRREDQADRLENNLEKLRALHEAEKPEE
jgi:hypothetical protein